ncbi:hypothetical protein F5B22DRAFT_628519 [Xylaria bambusicola]|uniref:uncharacterized protein n=1 Tax=Xylaria bambusicola TaxID=326684 RepID=UPI0020072944|nr:uncharacterized protein F5B22DRAFT_628519 [Xylaria bambusicola]KAI0505189.1 hypothetical protein F5B22DRAFT_628519 [Xylaria bambusicola]
MQFTTAALALLSASSVFAAPAAIPNWTITSMKRVCNTADTSCTWSFGIKTGSAAATPCSFVITGKPASHSDLTAMKTCGSFSVTAGWSGQFGPGFTTLAVHNNANGQIAWPAYTDAELAGGKAVTPDKSWAVTQL